MDWPLYDAAFAELTRALPKTPSAATCCVAAAAPMGSASRPLTESATVPFASAMCQTPT